MCAFSFSAVEGRSYWSCRINVKSFKQASAAEAGIRQNTTSVLDAHGAVQLGKVRIWFHKRPRKKMGVACNPGTGEAGQEDPSTS